MNEEQPLSVEIYRAKTREELRIQKRKEDEASVLQAGAEYKSDENNKSDNKASSNYPKESRAAPTQESPSHLPVTRYTGLVS